MYHIIEMVGGSHLYGTATPQSDSDYKGVFIPSGRSILLQTAPKVINESTGDSSSRNSALDVDRELFSISKYLQLVSEGQTLALEMLFAPEQAYIRRPDKAWIELLESRGRLLSRRSKAFVGYCRQQAAKYSAKAERLAAVRAAVVLLAEAVQWHGTRQPLGLIADQLQELAAAYPSKSGDPYITFVDVEMPGPRMIRHLQVCDKQCPFTSTLKEAHAIFARLEAVYGERARVGADLGMVDWKAMSHAVRIGEQAVEFYSTGQIILPRPNAEYLLAIKQGRVDKLEVMDLIEVLLERVEIVAEASSLPEEADSAWIEAFILRQHRRVISTLDDMFEAISPASAA